MAIRKSSMTAPAAHAAGSKAMAVTAAKAPALPIQARLSVNTPGDKYEREADSVADKVMRMDHERVMTSRAEPGIFRKCAHCEEKEKSVQKKENRPALGAPTAAAQQAPAQVEAAIKNSKGGGAPLSAQTQAFMSKAIGADFSRVRIHTGPRAAGMSKALHAHAFTHGSDIYFNEGQYQPESSAGRYLLAHELTHVVQQGAAEKQSGEAVRRSRSSAQKQSAETERRAPAVQREEQKEIQRRDGSDSVVQRLSLKDLNPLNVSIDDLVREYMPDLFAIKKAGGIFEWLKEKVSSAVEAMLKAVGATIKSAADFVSSLSPTMAKIINWIKTAGVKISRNDCSSFTELGAMIEQLVDELAGPAIEKIKSFAKKAGDWFTDIWTRFGLPVWEFIKQYVSDQWELIKSIGKYIWDKSAPVREWAAAVWVKIKNWIGIGEGPDGQNGILQWIEGKVKEIWAKVKEKVEPFKKQLLVMGAVLIALSPAGPLLAAGVVFTAILSAVKWIQANIKSPQDIVKLRVKFEKEILPKILGGLNGAIAGLQAVFGGLIGKLVGVSASVGVLLGMAAEGILSFIQSALQWVIDKFTEITEWATTKLNDLSTWLQGIFNSVRAFVIPLIAFFQKVSAVINNIMDLPLLILGGLWKMIPSCIRVPVQDFLVNVILKNIPFFEDVVALVGFWQKMKAGAMDIIKTVFINGDLKGGILKAFKLFLDILNIPVQLVISIFNKAKTAFNEIVNRPKAIFGNIVKAIKAGFQKFLGSFAKNAIDALGNWIFSKVPGIKMPKEYTLRSMFDLAMDILGFTEDNIFLRIEKKTSKKFAANLRKVYNGLKIAAKWVIDLFKDPKAAFEQLKQKISSLKSTLFASIGKWIAANIIGKFVSKMVAELATTPFGPAVEAIITAYNMFQTAKEYAAKILGIVDKALDGILDLVNGVIDKAAEIIEKGMVFGLEVAVAFVAKIVGIGDLPQKVKTIVTEDIRPMVDLAIDAIIDLVIGILKSIKELFTGEKKTPDEEKKDKEEKLGKGMEAGKKAVDHLSGRKVGQKVLKPILGGVRVLYGLTTLEAVEEGGKWLLKGSINPAAQMPTNVLAGVPEKRFFPGSVGGKAPGEYVRKNLYLYGTSYDSTSKTFRNKNVDAIISLVDYVRKMPPGPARDSEWKLMQQQGHVDPLGSGESIDTYDASNAIRKYQMDHKVDLAIHWGVEGYNQDESSLKAHTMNQDHWETKTLLANQGKKKERYQLWVGSNFSSSGSPKDSLTIEGVPYNDESGTPLK